MRNLAEVGDEVNGDASGMTADVKRPNFGNAADGNCSWTYRHISALAAIVKTNRIVC